MGLLQARHVPKPWGHEEIFAETDRYVGKILFVRAGEALSLQYHERKDETLRMLEGKIDLMAGETTEKLHTHNLEPGAVFHLPPGVLHRMVAVTDSVLLEVSTADLDDVVRVEDRYGRAGTSEP